MSQFQANYKDGSNFFHWRLSSVRTYKYQICKDWKATVEYVIFTASQTVMINIQTLTSDVEIYVYI